MQTLRKRLKRGRKVESAQLSHYFCLLTSAFHSEDLGRIRLGNMGLRGNLGLFAFSLLKRS